MTQSEGARLQWLFIERLGPRNYRFRRSGIHSEDIFCRNVIGETKSVAGGYIDIRNMNLLYDRFKLQALNPNFSHLNIIIVISFFIEKLNIFSSEKHTIMTYLK